MAKHGILMVVGHYKPLIGGALNVYDALARYAPEQFHILTAKRDYETGAVVDGFEAFDSSVPYKITRLDRMRPDAVAGQLSFFRRIINKIKSDKIEKKILKTIKDLCAAHELDTVIISASDAMSWLPVRLKSCSWATQLRLVYYTHGEEMSQRAWAKKGEAARKAALLAVDGIITVSRFTADLMTKRYAVKRDKIFILTNGVDYEHFALPQRQIRGEGTAQPSSLTVVAAGRLVARKGFDTLLAAWPKIIAQVPGAHLKIVGDGPLFDSLTRIIETRKLQKSVTMLGFVEEDALVSLYREAALFCMPNRTMPDGDTEGFGLVFLEAAAAGTPSIGGRAGGAPDAIKHGETGLLIDGTSGDVIVDAVVSLLSDDERRLKMAAAAQKYAKSNTWEVKTKQLLDHIAVLHKKTSRYGHADG